MVLLGRSTRGFRSLDDVIGCSVLCARWIARGSRSSGELRCVGLEGR